jgi:hypothetical protein
MVDEMEKFEIYTKFKSKNLMAETTLGSDDNMKFYFNKSLCRGSSG